MLLKFICGNYLSFKDEQILDLQAVPAVKEYQEDNVFEEGRYKLLKSAVIYGANGSGKSNLLKAMDKMKWLVINSSKNVQKSELLYIDNFRLSTETLNNPSRFEITILIDSTKYRYGFEANNSEIQTEWLYTSRKIKEDPLFIREGEMIQVFSKFREGNGLEERTRENALFLSVCAQFNGEISDKILSWFANFNIISGIDDRLFQSFSENMFMNDTEGRLVIMDLLKKADLGINDMDIKRQKITEDSIPSSIPKELKNILVDKEGSVISTFHDVYDEHKNSIRRIAFDFDTQESEGSKKYFRLSGPVIDSLQKGKVLIIDELDARLHPILTIELVKLFNTRKSNPHNAQLIFATHDTNLLNANIFRRDQIWFTEKDHEEATDLYSLVEYKMTKGKVRNDASYEKDYIRGRYGAIPYIGDFQNIWVKMGKAAKFTDEQQKNFTEGKKKTYYRSS